MTRAFLPLLLGFAASAAACPVCNTETGAQVRDNIFGPNFLPTFLAVLAPFPIVLGILAGLLWGPDCCRKMRRKLQTKREL